MRSAQCWLEGAVQGAGFGRRTLAGDSDGDGPGSQADEPTSAEALDFSHGALLSTLTGFITIAITIKHKTQI